MEGNEAVNAPVESAPIESAPVESAPVEETRSETPPESTETVETEGTEQVGEEAQSEPTTYSKEDFERVLNERLTGEKTKYEEQAKAHQAAFTKAAQERAALAKELESFKAAQREMEISQKFQALDNYGPEAKPLVDLIKSQYMELAQIKEQLGSISPLVSTMQQGVDQQRYLEIKKDFPEVENWIKDPQFAAWQKETGYDRFLHDDASVDDVKFGLRAYQREMKLRGMSEAKDKATAQQKAKGDALKAPGSKVAAPKPNNQTFSREQIARMSPAEFAKNKGAILAAQEKGLIKP